jgi:DNA invertase Pin-like site-specific DNA recombinase
MSGVRPRAYSYVRMSTPEQLKGHSRQRQLELSTAFAGEHDLELVPDAQLEDLGVSAFKGANVKDGALGRFLKAAESGAIPKGSYLLVESLDRISRQDILDAQALFLRIITAGIKLVTLQDNRVYSAESTTQFSDLILSLSFMSVAHEESEKKSKRGAAAWSEKRARAKAKSQPLTKWCTAWLRLSPDRSHYEIDRQRVAIVQSIFQEAVAGIGILKIGKRLNERQIPVANPTRQHTYDYSAANRDAAYFFTLASITATRRPISHTSMMVRPLARTLAFLTASASSAHSTALPRSVMRPTLSRW